MDYLQEHNVQNEPQLSPAELLARSLGLTLEGPQAVDKLNEQFIDSLPRITKQEVTNDDFCGICRDKFTDDEYMLVVKVPCPGNHLFDLECVRTWLLKQGTCPLCRHDFTKTKPKSPPLEDSEEEVDDMYM